MRSSGIVALLASLVTLLAGPARASNQIVLGKTFTVKDPAPGVDASLRNIVVLGQELVSAATVNGNPVQSGAVIQIVANGASPTDQTFTLPPGLAGPGVPGWKPLAIGYTYKDAAGINGPVKAVTFKKAANGKFVLKVTLKGALGPGPQPHITVVPPAPGTDGGMVFTIPAGDSYCVAFGGAAGGAVTNSPTNGPPLKVFKVAAKTTFPTTEAGCPSPPTTSSTSTSTSSSSSSSTSTSTSSSSSSSSSSTTTSTTSSTTTSTDPACAVCDPNATCTPSGNPVCTCNPGYEGDGQTCTAVAVSLIGLRWEIPCGATQANPAVCSCTDPAAQMATIGGAAEAQYDVAMRFRGVVEQKTYTGGVADGYWYTGGSAPFDFFNVYRLDVSDPPQTYFLNAGASNIYYCFGIDYTRTVRMKTGATVTLTAQSAGDSQIRNIDSGGQPIVAPGIPPAPAAYDGQFIQMDVVSVTLVP